MRHKTSAVIKKEIFDNDLQEMARLAKALSHPARLAILRYLAQSKTCISGDISNHIPLSRTTVSQHLTELKEIGIIHGEIDGLKVNYCLCNDKVKHFKSMFDELFATIDIDSATCC